MATNDGGQDSAGASEADVADATESDGPVGTSMGIGDDMGELSDDSDDSESVDNTPNTEGVTTSGQGHPGDRSPTDSVPDDMGQDDTDDEESANPYDAYETEDLEDMVDEFDKRQAALPTRHKADAIALRNELAQLTANIRSTNPANIFGISYQKDRHTEKDKQDMVQAFKDKNEDAITAMSKAHSAEVDAQRGKKGALKGAFDATRSPAGMLMGLVGGPVGTLGMAITGLLTEMGLNYTAIDIETDLDSLMQEVGLKEKDGQSDVSDPDAVFLKAECEERDGYRWDDAMATCVVDTIKKADPIDVVNPY